MLVVFDKLSKLAKDSFKALGGKSLGRIDIKMDHLGEPSFYRSKFNARSAKRLLL